MPRIHKNKIIAYVDEEGKYFHPECLHGYYSKYYAVTKLDDPNYVLACDECRRLIWIGEASNQSFTKN
jgi:hypothetical protein